MGTDIHSIAQVKRDGQWVTVAFGESQLGDIEKALTLVAERAGAQPEDLRFVYGFDS